MHRVKYYLVSVVLVFMFSLVPVNALTLKSSPTLSPTLPAPTSTLTPTLTSTPTSTVVPTQKISPTIAVSEIIGVDDPIAEYKNIIRQVIDKKITLQEADQLIAEKNLNLDCGRIVDDSDKANGCYITWTPWEFQASGYAGTSEYTTQVTSQPYTNEASWVTQNINDTVEVKISVPQLPTNPGTFVTSAAEFHVVHTNGEDVILIDQLRNQGEILSLGEFTFASNAVVYVTNYNTFNLQDIVLADMVSFGEELPPDTDILPPKIENVKTHIDGSFFFIEAKVTDDKSGVAEVTLLLNGNYFPMQNDPGTNIYSAKALMTPLESMTYQIIASDNTGNEAIWDPTAGYLTRASLATNLGFPHWAFYPDIYSYLQNSKNPCLAGNICNSGYVGDPVNTYNGNLVETIKLIYLPGRPKVDFHITYNSAGGRSSVFGENWTHSYNYNLLEMNNVHLRAAFVQFPDGRQVGFRGPNYTPDAGNFEKLVKSGNEFTLSLEDKTKIKFDANGNVTRIEDIDGNGVTFEYTRIVPFTLLSQITKITADGGRSIDLHYNAEGLVDKVSSAEGKELHLEYTNNDLTKLVDGNDGETRFEYDNHQMTKKISPKGHNYFVNTYDSEGRIATQTMGASFYSSFQYQENGSEKVVTVTDAYNKATIYTYMESGLLTKIQDPEGYTIRYEYDPDTKKLLKEIDKDNNETIYDYDDYGNIIYEKDALGFEVHHEYNLDFNKPSKKIYKQPDHITKWEYNETGHLIKNTNATNAFQDFKYNNLGQLTEARDFNGNKTTYTYNTEGDIKTETDALGKTTTYFYDGLGRIVKVQNKRGYELIHTYDNNDNLKKVTGSLGYKVEYEYDLNNNKTKEIDANGHATEYFYDTSENLIKIKNALGFEITKAYGLMNELLTLTDAEGRITKYFYDDLYTVTKTITAFGTADEATTHYEYNGMRNTTKVTDANGVVTKFTYNKLQLKTEQIVNYIEGGPVDHQTNVKTKYEYSPTGALIKVTDANGHTTTNELDVLDRVKKITDAENQVTEYTYDNQGNVELVKNPRGYTTEYSYDDLNRKVGITDSLFHSTNYHYDENNNLIFVQDANGVYTRYIYNELDRKTETIYNFVHEAPPSESVNVRIKYEYDAVGNLKKTINPKGFSTTYNYDAVNRNTSITDTYNKTAQFEYDKVNNLRKKIDRNGNQLQYFYDNQNRLAKLVDQENHFEEYKYDDLGNRTQFINKRSKVYNYQYDPLNRVTKITDPLNNFKKFTYDAAGNNLSITDENNFTTTHVFDKVNRLKSTTDPENNTTQYIYDQNSNKKKQIDAEGNATIFEYDNVDRLKSVTNAELEKEEYAYDKMLNRVLLREADGTYHKYEYDKLYRLTKVVDNYKDGLPASHDTNVPTNFKYDVNGNNTEIIDPNNNSTKFAYDDLDRLKEELNPLNKKWTFVYDNETNVVTRTDANNVAVSYEYYPDYQLKKTIYPSYAVEYQYSNTNFPTQMVDNLGITIWGYDDLDRLVSQNDALGRGLTYTYDPASNLKKLTYPDGKYLEHTYYKNNWPKTSTTSDQESVEFTHNKVGSIVYIQRSNDSYSSITYDKVYRPLLVDDHQQGGGNHLIHKFEYTYNDIGHITREVANYGWRQPQQVVTDNQYDGLHRLTRANSSDGQDTNYSYDAAGNRTIQTEQTQQGLITKSLSYNNANQVVAMNVVAPQNPDNELYTFSYDNNGNRTYRLIEGNGADQATDYQYDPENRLIEVYNHNANLLDSETLQEGVEVLAQPNKTKMKYDGNGRSLIKEFYPGGSSNPKTTEYVYDRKDPIAEYDTWNNQRRDYFRDQNQDLWMFQKLTGNNLDADTDKLPDYVQEDMLTGKELYLVPPGTLYFYHYDGEGNIGATSKHSAQSDHAYRYDEFGAVLPENGNWTAPHNEYTLNQKEIDSYTGLVYFGARYYDPELGIWLTQDTYRGESKNPMSLHRYMYNYNSPINYQDAYGNSPNQVQSLEQTALDSNNSWFDTYKSFSRYCNQRRDELNNEKNMSFAEEQLIWFGGASLAIGDSFASLGLDLIELNSEASMWFDSQILGIDSDHWRMRNNQYIISTMQNWRSAKDQWLIDTAGVGDEIYYKDDQHFLSQMFSGFANIQYAVSPDYTAAERGFLGGKIFMNGVDVIGFIKGLTKSGTKAGTKLLGSTDNALVSSSDELVEGVVKNSDGLTKSSLKGGQTVHKLYKADLVDGKMFKKEFRLPSGKRIDYIDFQTKTIYELKPNNPRSINLGNKQLEMYKQEVESIYGSGWTTKLDTY